MPEVITRILLEKANALPAQAFGRLQFTSGEGLRRSRTLMLSVLDDGLAVNINPLQRVGILEKGRMVRG